MTDRQRQERASYNAPQGAQQHVAETGQAILRRDRRHLRSQLPVIIRREGLHREQHARSSFRLERDQDAARAPGADGTFDPRLRAQQRVDSRALGRRKAFVGAQPQTAGQFMDNRIIHGKKKRREARSLPPLCSF